MHMYSRRETATTLTERRRETTGKKGRGELNHFNSFGVILIKETVQLMNNLRRKLKCINHSRFCYRNSLLRPSFIVAHLLHYCSPYNCNVRKQIKYTNLYADPKRI